MDNLPITFGQRSSKKAVKATEVIAIASGNLS